MKQLRKSKKDNIREHDVTTTKEQYIQQIQLKHKGVDKKGLPTKYQ